MVVNGGHFEFSTNSLGAKGVKMVLSGIVFISADFLSKG